MVSTLILVASVNGFFFLRETLPPQVCLPSEYSISYGISKHSDNLLQPERSSGIRSLLALPTMRALCLSGFALSFVGTAFDVLFVLFCYSPITSGGLSFTVSAHVFSVQVLLLTPFPGFSNRLRAGDCRPIISFHSTCDLAISASDLHLHTHIHLLHGSLAFYLLTSPNIKPRRSIWV